MDWVTTSGVTKTCLVERDEVSGVEARTWLLERRGVNGGAAVYTSSMVGSAPRYVTVFPVRGSFSARMREAAGDDGPLKGRFNAVLPPTSGEVASRTLIT